MIFDELVENFSLFDDWEDRYRYIIDLGRKMPPFPEQDRTPAHKVDGCMSQVWLTHSLQTGENGELRVVFQADSDAHIVRGLLAVLLILLSDKTPEDILGTDADAALARIDLDQHISPNRRNGVAAVVGKIRAAATAALAQRGG